MRIAAQIAMVVLATAWVAMFRWPILFFGAIQIVYLSCAWVVAWYVIFTLPRELVDRHAGRAARDEAPRRETAEASGGLADYHIHRA
jgi:polyferredoxin